VVAVAVAVSGQTAVLTVDLEAPRGIRSSCSGLPVGIRVLPLRTMVLAGLAVVVARPGSLTAALLAFPTLLRTFLGNDLI